MQKLLLLFILAGALLFALYLKLAGREIPLTGKGSGVKGKFWLAAAIFAAFFGCKSVSDSENKSGSEMGTTPKNTMGSTRGTTAVTTAKKPSPSLAATIQKVWRSLHVQSVAQFKVLIEAEVKAGRIEPKVGTALSQLYAELTMHKDRTRGENRVKCYKHSALGSLFQMTRENILVRIEAIEKARNQGALNRETTSKLMSTLAMDLERWHRAKKIDDSDYRKAAKKIEELRKALIIPSTFTNTLASTVMELQVGTKPAVDLGLQLARMKRRVEALYRKGPKPNDWMDPDINPNILKILESHKIISVGPMVSCYDRMASPSPARSKELLQLQKQLLDKNIKAGVLDVETAARAATAPPVTYASQKDVALYQKRVRRLTRLLYKHGELPSSFVKKIEKVIGVSIITFTPKKQLVNDVTYYITSSLYNTGGEPLLKALISAGVIRKARNHKGLYRAHATNAAAAKRTARLVITDLKSTTPLVLKEDAGKTVKLSSLPKAHRAYILKVRRAARALIANKVTSYHAIKHLERAIGISLVGRLELDK